MVKHKLILSAPVLGLTGATASLEAVPKQVLVLVCSFSFLLQFGYKSCLELCFLGLIIAQKLAEESTLGQTSLPNAPAHSSAGWMICSFATAKALIEILDINLVKSFPVICRKCNIIILHISRDSLSLRMETSWKPGQTSGNQGQTS